MKARAKFLLWTGLLWVALLAIAAALGVALAAGLPEADGAAVRRVLAERAPLLAFAAVILLFVCAGVVKWLFDEYVVAIHALAEQTGVVLGANRALRVSTEGAREARRVQSTGSRRPPSCTYVDGPEASASRGGATALPRLSELTEGVLVQLRGRILLCSEQARIARRSVCARQPR
jgi:hypothetical protein